MSFKALSIISLVTSLNFFMIGCDSSEEVSSADDTSSQVTNTPPASLVQCTSGSYRPCGDSSCSGTLLCGENGFWPGEEECKYPSELCDGFDQDCDGSVDEDFTQLTTACDYTLDTCAAQGHLVCNEAGDGVECRLDPTSVSAETCDEVDNDCDGSVDEDYRVGEVCDDGIGECNEIGALVCNEEGTDVLCNATPKNPAESESCNSRDDDCDGSVDEDFSELGNICSIGQGVCVGEGVYECTGSG